MKEVKILSKKNIKEPMDVYDISIDNDDHYYILDNGIISHNTFDKYNPTTSSGGSGPRYMCDIMLNTSKGKQKEGTEQIGVVITVKNEKSRFMQENKKAKLMVSFKNGLYKYSNLVELAYEFGAFKKDGISFLLPDGTKAKMKDVREKTAQYMNEVNLKAIRDVIKENWGFGASGIDTEGFSEAAGSIDDTEEFELED